MPDTTNHINTGPGGSLSDDALVSYLLGEADANLRLRVENWIAASPANQRYFEHFRLIWETSAGIAATAAVDEQQAWQRLRQRIHAEEGRRPGKLRTIGRHARHDNTWKAAAAVVLLLGAAALVQLLNKPGAHAVTFASLDIPKSDTLPDGSVATLNKHSAIEYDSRFSGKQRKLKLSGEAFFQVTPDPEKPFVVQTDDLQVTVLGTSFNIKSTDSSTEVIVETGIVKVEKNNSEIILRQGEKLVIGSADSVLRKEQTSDQLHNYYRTKVFVCDRTPLWKLVETLNAAYESRIVIDNKELRQLPLTATFQDEPLDSILRVIAETFNLSVEHHNDTILIK